MEKQLRRGDGGYYPRRVTLGSRIAALGLAAALAGCAGSPGAARGAHGFTARELDIILTLSPLPDPPPDPTNAVADNPAAAHLGRFLFFDRGLSPDKRLSCASCHDPAKDWSDGRTIPSATSRHVPSLWNVAYARWFFWDGRADSLGSQALQPIENPRELGGSREEVEHRIRADAALAAAYQSVFGPLESTDRIFSNVGKAIAAFERKLISRNSPFDAYVAALRSGDRKARRAYPKPARRGLKLFVGRAGCVLCHNGPTFSDKEFHALEAPDDSQDLGRFDGIPLLLRDPFNGLGKFSDAPEGGRRLPTAFLANSEGFRSAFKTPGLRNVARTAPYFHRGQFKSLEQVVKFYSAGNGTTLRPLNLSESEIADLVAFLRTLTGSPIDPELLQAPASSGVSARN
jgi:cytochrome c peroxidase